MPRINSNSFYQNWPKIKLFLPKKSFFSSAGCMEFWKVVGDDDGS